MVVMVWCCCWLAAGPGDASEEAVQEPEDRHGERAVPGADDRGVQRRHAGDQGREPGAVQRDPPLARPPAAAERVGGRAGVRDAVPNPPRRQLHVPVHHPGPGGHAVVARAQLLAPRHRARRAHHPPQEGPPLPFPQATNGGPHHPRYIQVQPVGNCIAGWHHQCRRLTDVYMFVQPSGGGGTPSPCSASP